MSNPIDEAVESKNIDERACTCHPDDNPPKPCPRQFALTECRAKHADDRIGFWLSAALDDPNVCEEMKADIRAWFDAR